MGKVGVSVRVAVGRQFVDSCSFTVDHCFTTRSSV